MRPNPGLGLRCSVESVRQGLFCDQWCNAGHAMQIKYGMMSGLCALLLAVQVGSAAAQGMPAPVGHDAGTSGDPATAQTLFTNVHVFDGVNEARIENASVLIEGNLVRTVSTDPIAAEGATVIDGGGRTLMPGLIDAHWHTMYVGIPIEALVSGDMVEAAARAVPKAEATLMRGFTTVRDMGGPAESLKKIIDAGVIPGPRILPSGPGISQTSGHFDYRDYQAIPASDGDPMAYWYRTRMFGLADGVPEMLKRVRENLRMGASQIKLATAAASRRSTTLSTCRNTRWRRSGRL